MREIAHRGHAGVGDVVTGFAYGESNMSLKICAPLRRGRDGDLAGDPGVEYVEE
ncbi:MAG TPA: hypothetical protein VIK91_04315 [Nannocystis sp.]